MDSSLIKKPCYKNRADKGACKTGKEAILLQFDCLGVMPSAKHRFTSALYIPQVSSG